MTDKSLFNMKYTKTETDAVFTKNTQRNRHFTIRETACLIFRLSMITRKRDRESWKIPQSSLITIILYKSYQATCIIKLHIVHMHVSVHTHASASTCPSLSCFVHRRLYHIYRLIELHCLVL